MRKLTTIILALLIGTTMMGQKTKKAVSFTANGLPDQLKEYLLSGNQDDKAKEYTKAATDFRAVYEALAAAQQQRMAALYSDLVGGKTKTTRGEVAKAMTQFTDFASKPAGKANVGGWLDCAEAMKAKSNKKFFSFNPGSRGLE